MSYNMKLENFLYLQTKLVDVAVSPVSEILYCPFFPVPNPRRSTRIQPAHILFIGVVQLRKVLVTRMWKKEL